ncbi:MAG: MFS transporter [Candidatus Thorarchaeota archaeon]
MPVRSRMLLSTSTIHFLNHITLYAFPSIVIFIRDDIPLNYSEIGIIAAIPTLLMVLLTPLTGRTRTGFESWVILSGLFVMGFSIALMGNAQTIFDLMLASVVLGVGGAAYHPPGFSMVSIFYDEKKAEALSLNQGAGVVGTALAPFFLVGSASLLGWRETLLFCGSLTILTIFPTAVLLVGVSEALRSLNSKGSNPENYPGESSLARSGSLLLAALSLPLIVALFLSACRSTVFRTVTFFTVALMKDFYGLSKRDSGIVSSIILLMGAVSSFLGGRLSDRLENGRMKVLIVSAIGMVLFSILLALLGQDVTRIVGIAIYALFICFYFFAAANFSALLAEMVPIRLRTVAFGLNFSLGQAAGALAPIIFGYLLDTYGFAAGMVYLMLVSVASLLIIGLLRRIVTEKPVSNATAPPVA